MHDVSRRIDDLDRKMRWRILSAQRLMPLDSRLVRALRSRGRLSVHSMKGYIHVLLKQTPRGLRFTFGFGTCAVDSRLAGQTLSKRHPLTAAS